MSENQRLVFVKNLRNYMDMRGVDQSAIVSSLGVSASTVSDWATGKKYPRVDSMQRLADFLGVLISDLTMDPDSLHDKLDPAFGSDTPAVRKLRALGDELGVSTLEGGDERELITIFRRLNNDGQSALLRQAHYLDADPEMKKGGESSSGTA